METWCLVITCLESLGGGYRIDNEAGRAPKTASGGGASGRKAPPDTRGRGKLHASHTHTHGDSLGGWREGCAVNSNWGWDDSNVGKGRVKHQ